MLFMENLYFTPKPSIWCKNYQEIDVDAYFTHTNWKQLFVQLTHLNPDHHIQPSYQNYKMLEHDLKFLTLIVSEQLTQQYPEFKLNENQKEVLLKFYRRKSTNVVLDFIFE